VTRTTRTLLLTSVNNFGKIADSMKSEKLTLAKNGVGETVKDKFAYHNLWETTMSYTQNPVTKEIENIIPGVLKPEMLPYVHRSPKREVFVVLKEEDVFGENSKEREELKDWLKNSKTNGLPHCCYIEEIQQDGITFQSTCMQPVEMVIGLDINASIKYRKGACGEEHGLAIMGKITDNLNSKPENNLIIEEWEDWDYMHPPIFVTYKNR